ncbi:MAG TPA: hypothetical protein VGX75_16270 [bacterium]|nr:hypothetical protein [bacterium]
MSRIHHHVTVFVILACLGGLLLPAAAEPQTTSTQQLRTLFSHLLGDPPLIHMEAVPDLYDGGYARVSLYGRHVMIKGMLIDELWIKLVGVSFDPAELRRGTLKVLDIRDNAIYGKLSLAAVQDFLNQQAAVRDVQLGVNAEAITGAATVVYNGIPTRVRMQGIFQVDGDPEVFFHIQALSVNSIPVPYVLAANLERQINPVVDFRTWPVQFKIRTFKQTPEGFVLSSQRDFAQPCDACGGPPLQLAP